MRVQSIDSRGNARRICHAKKYYVIYLRLDGLQACLRVTGSFPEDFRDIPSPRRGERVTYEGPISHPRFISFVNLGRSFSLYYARYRTAYTPIVAQRRKGEGRINFYDGNQRRCWTRSLDIAHMCTISRTR